MERVTCSGCGAYLSPGLAVCERCGRAVPGATNHDERGPDLIDRLFAASWHALWKWLWVFWTIAYPVLWVSALVTGGNQPPLGSSTGVFDSFVVGGTFAWPWLVGVIVLGVLYTVTRTES